MNWTLPLQALHSVADMPSWLAWTVTPVLIAWVAGQTDHLPPTQRWVPAVAFWGGVMALASRLARHGLEHWHLPGWLWVVGAILVPLVLVRQELTSARLMLVVWLVSLAGCTAWVADLWGLAAVLNGLLFLVAGSAWGASTVLRALQPPGPPPPPPPPPSPPPPSPLVQHLDSDDAQEGADKYTRE